MDTLFPSKRSNVVEAKRFTFDPTPQQRATAASYATIAKSPKFAQQKETAVRSLLIEKVLVDILGDVLVWARTGS